MPAGIARVVGMRKAHRKGAKAIARTPAPLAYELIERVVERGRIDRLPERLLSVSRKSNDRFCPRSGVVGITREVPPHDRTGFLAELPREGAVHANKALL